MRLRENGAGSENGKKGIPEVDIQIEDVPPFKVVHLSGDVDMHSSPNARHAIIDCLKRKVALLVELSGVTYMDSSGVASLVEGYQLAKREGVEFGLVAVAVPAMNVLKLARLDKVFPIHASIAERLARNA